jgi:hypothetical protein
MTSASDHTDILMRTASEGMSTYRETLSKKDEEIQRLRREVEELKAKGKEYND